MTDTPTAVETTPAPAFTPTEEPTVMSEEAQIADLRAAYDKAQGGEDTETEEAPAPAEEPEEAPVEEKDEAPLAEVIAAPSHLPEDIQAVWKDIPEAARPALERSYRSLGDRLAQQGRVVSAVKPSYDVLVRAAQEMPELAQMSPAQIAEGVFSLARREAQFVKDPVGTLLGLAQEHGQIDALRAALSGQAPQQQFNPKELLGTVQQQIPAIVQQYVTQELQQQAALNEVTAFAASAEHWAAVEDAVPSFLPLAVKKLGEGASAKDKLKLAYDMAIHADPDLRAKVSASKKQEPEPDPKKAEEAARAASINVTSRGASKPAVLSERQMLEAAWREAQRR